MLSLTWSEGSKETQKESNFPWVNSGFHALCVNIQTPGVLPTTYPVFWEELARRFGVRLLWVQIPQSAVILEEKSYLSPICFSVLVCKVGFL